MSEWISVKDRMPEKKRAVLVYAPHMDEPIVTMYFDPDDQMAEFGEWVSDCTPNRLGWSSMTGEDVTHWMPLPEPPKP